MASLSELCQQRDFPELFTKNQFVAVGKLTYRLTEMKNLKDKTTTTTWILQKTEVKSRSKKFNWEGFKKTGKRAAAKTTW
jgi:hypothetical protein